MIMCIIFAYDTCMRSLVLKYSLGLMLLPLAFASCNSDLFVEHVEPLESEVTLEGDGGIRTIRFQPKGLQRIYISHAVDGADVVYYDRAGAELSSGDPAADVARISYAGRLVMFEILIDGDHMTVNSIEAAGNQPWHAFIGLDYGYITELISIELLPGQPVEMVGMDYVMSDMSVQSVSKTDIKHTTYKNQGASEVKVEILPYIAQQARALFEPDDPWWRYIEVKAALPVCVDDRWRLSGREYDMALGSSTYYFPEGLDRTLSVSVVIPPYSEKTITTTVTYSSVRVPFFLTLRNPVSGRESIVFGVCGVIQPVSYEISVDDSK